MTDTNYHRTGKEQSERLINGRRDNIMRDTNQVRSRKKWKKLSSRSARRKDRYHEEGNPEKVRQGVGSWWNPKERNK